MFLFAKSPSFEKIQDELRLFVDRRLVDTEVQVQTF
jgi:hypothetical protein